MSEKSLPAHFKRILIVEDEHAMALAYEDYFSEMGYQVVIASTGQKALDKLKKEQYSVVISDMLLPDAMGLELFRQQKQQQFAKVSPAWIMITGHATFDNAVEVIKEGVDHYFVKPINLQQLEVFVSRCVETYATRYQNWLYRHREQKQVLEDKLIGQSKEFREMVSLARTAAASEATILIRGESGTGKELVAELIHSASPRASKPFIKVNCGAIPENLLEAELFGYEQGAFTDAKKRKKGKFELANEGTIFLDEIGEMTPKLQVKLLRVLQAREVERLGGQQTIPLDIRLVAATSRNLEEMISQQQFREDVYYRINVITIKVPPLRDRTRDDIYLLVSHFLEKFNSKNKKLFSHASDEVMQLLANYNWPGNVRELENVIERAVVLGTGTELTTKHLPEVIRNIEPRSDNLIDRILDQDISLEQLERDLIRRAIVLSSGNVSQAARKLGLTRRTLQYRMEKHKLTREECMAEIQELKGLQN